LTCPAGEQVTVGQVSHHSIELIWTREHDTKGYNTRFTVENLEPKTTTFRLKVTWPSGHQRYYPSCVCVIVFLSEEPLNGRNLHNAVLKSDELELCRLYVDIPDKLDFTPLMMAAMKGFTIYLSCVFLMLACFHGHLNVVKGSSRDGSGCCALHWAADGCEVRGPLT
uniref:Uncharacterized protein n=1 Tax=Sinocyclocheilus rhinocerous TaxID=307959 RepID=A0A673INW3_9TELE